jgi:hypothetical protein
MEHERQSEKNRKSVIYRRTLAPPLGKPSQHEGGIETPGCVLHATMNNKSAVAKY